MSTENVNAYKGNIKATGAVGLSYTVKKSFAAKAGGSAKESHAVASLDEVLALKALLEMSEDKDEKIWQDMISGATRMLRTSAGAI